MRIEFWLDYLCPVSYLTHKNLLAALKELNINNYELYYRSYQLKENCTDELLVKTMADYYDEKTFKKTIAILDKEYPKYKELKMFDTSLAHQLAHLAKRFNLQVVYNMEVLKAYFEEGLEISDANILKQIGIKIGLEPQAIDYTLMSKCYKNQIAINKENASIKGINYIPHLRVNIKENFNQYLSKGEIKKIIVEAINHKGIKREICGEYCEY
ncbi:MAG: DsbA family protein [Acholeplasma sp.]|nr:DsbA family protein [Acholeplasma sp.]